MTSKLDLNFIEERRNHRTVLLRRAAIMTPGAMLSTGLLVWAIMHLPSSIFATIILGLSSAALLLESVSALRDLPAQPVQTRGRIARLWKKSRYLFFGRIDYMLVDGTLFEVNAVTAMELHEGEEVVVEHWPHSNIIASVARPPAEPAPPPMSFGEPDRP
ncbi:MAG: hypothetical protein WD734_06275 [Dehalococcoidia bacterium]